MNIKLAVSLMAVMSLFVACSNTTNTPTPRPVQIKSQPIDRPAISLPDVDEFRARDVSWTIVTPDNASEVFAKLEASGQPVVLFGLTENGYENISLNIQEALAIVLQQQSVIDAYQVYYVTTDSLIETHNNNQ